MPSEVKIGVGCLYDAVARKIFYPLAAVGESRYVDVYVAPRGGIADFEVLY